MVLALRACVICVLEFKYVCRTTLGWTGSENMTRNSAIADKPRDEFVQMQWRGWPERYAPPYVTMPNLVLLHSRVVGINTGEPQNWGALDLRSLGRWGVAWRCTPLLRCVITSNLIVLRKRVYTVNGFIIWYHRQWHSDYSPIFLVGNPWICLKLV